MAGALVSGWVKSGVLPASQIMASVPERDAQLLEPLQDLGCQTSNANSEVAAFADVLVLAVKPQVVPLVAKDLRTVDDNSNRLLVSVAAGIDLAKLEGLYGPGWRYARAMPNTGVTVCEGATVFCLGNGATLADSHVVQTLFSSVGLCHRVGEEKMMDGVTGISGSGPAYMYMVLEAMADEGVRQGLDRKVSYSLAAQTMVGAGRMVLDTGAHPGVLKDEVTSPAGSTIAALKALEVGGLRATMMEAVAAASDRCR